MSGAENSDKEQIAVGKCPVHGLVAYDDLDFNFPNPAKCWCGRECTSATVADAEEVARHV